jgi:PLP dependent protein
MYQELKKIANQHHATLVAVSKFKPASAIQILYDLGQIDFGENYVQEMVEKQSSLPNDIRWHFIGHLQRNKVKYIAPFVQLIHTVDSVALLEEINKQALKNNRVIQCLIQIKINEEDTKSGLEIRELASFFNEVKNSNFTNVNIIGVMGMSTFTEDMQQVRKEFKTLKNTFDEIKRDYYNDALEFKEISMGMSGDYTIALDEGSTMLRIGTLLFGER